MKILVSDSHNRTANKWLHEKVESLDASSASAYAFTCGEIHAAFILGVISQEQYEELEQLVDKKFYDVNIK